MSAIDFWLAEHQRSASSLPGADLPWLAALRARAIARFAAEAWPTTRQENWHHTSLAFMAQQMLDGGSPAAPDAQVAALRQANPRGHWLVFVDGRFAPRLSAVGDLPAGVRLGSLADALAQEPAPLEAVFGRAEDGDSPAALNAAFAADGAWVRLEPGTVVEQPIHLVFVFAGQAHRHQRNLILAEAAAQASIVEHYPAQGEASTLTTAVTRIRLGARSRISHLKLQQEGPQAIHLATLEVEQAGGACFASHSLSFGARLARHDIRTRLEGEGAEALLNGLYHADGRRHVDHHTRIDHNRPQGTSREHYRGLLDGSAHGVFAGRIVVAQDAQRSDAMQRCDSLLLSPQAQSDARPELEIYADDVKCAHGATVGQIDEDALFYLRTRGIDPGAARELLTYAFAAEVIGRIAEPALRRIGHGALLASFPVVGDMGGSP